MKISGFLVPGFFNPRIIPGYPGTGISRAQFYLLRYYNYIDTKDKHSNTTNALQQINFTITYSNIYICVSLMYVYHLLSYIISTVTIKMFWNGLQPRSNQRQYNIYLISPKEIEIVHRLSLVRISYCVETCRVTPRS